MSIDLPESDASADAPITMSVEELENVTGGSLGGLLVGVGEFVSGDVATVTSIVSGPDTGFTSWLGTPAAIGDVVSGVNDISANL